MRSPSRPASDSEREQGQSKSCLACYTKGITNRDRTTSKRSRLPFRSGRSNPSRLRETHSAEKANSLSCITVVYREIIGRNNFVPRISKRFKNHHDLIRRNAHLQRAPHPTAPVFGRVLTVTLPLELICVDDGMQIPLNLCTKRRFALRTVLEGDILRW